MILTPAPIVDELTEWEDIIRTLWKHRLPALDMVNIWHMPDNSAISLYSFVFRVPNNNTHHATDWFLVDPYLNTVMRHNKQHMLYAAITPARGLCDLLWKRGDTWYTMCTSPYAFNIGRDYKTGRIVNKEEKL